MYKTLSNFKNIYLMFFSIAYIYAMLIPGYFGITPSGVFSIFVDDGWCDSQVQGIGKHCFGDFYYPILSSNMANPWSDSPNPNPPLTNYIFKLLAPISDNGRAGLVVYFVFLLIMFSTPFMYLLAKRNLETWKLYFIFFIIITSAPILIAIDRGSISLLMFPLIFFLYESYSLKNEKLSNVILVAMILLKPQMFFFNFILLGRYNLLKFSRLIFSEIVLLGFSFLLYPSHLLVAIKDYLHKSISYQNQVPWGDLFPTNLSITNLFGILFGSLNSNIAVAVLRLILTLIIFLPIVHKIYRYRKQIGTLELLIFIIFITIFMPGVTFTYYLTLLLVPLLIGAVIWERGNRNELSFLFKGKLLKYIGGTSLILLFIPWTIPWSMILVGNSDKFLLTGINWLPGIIMLQIYFIGAIWNLGKVSQQK